MIAKEGSTDIYDAVVSHYREDNAYILDKTASRKPPLHSTNWRTTYRLKQLALVAVVKRLPKRGCPLNDTFEICWAKIVLSSPASLKGKEAIDEDNQNKDQGRIAVQLLGEGDCPGFPTESELHLDIGSNVAIIDLRVFVPEVITVLSALSNNFSNGIKGLCFSNQMLGIGAKVDNTLKQSTDIHFAIMNSRVPLIQSLPEPLRHEFSTSVNNLSSVSTLDTTQRQAFVAALYHPLHCTQGPPGTGKSYSGVCLVQAFHCLREIYKQKLKQEIGPILVLSYKNHALDEFMKDILEKIPVRPGVLIRVGNATDITLKEYADRCSSAQYKAQRELQRRIKVLRSARRLHGEWYKCLGLLSKADTQEENDDCISTTAASAFSCAFGFGAIRKRTELEEPDGYECFDCVSSVLGQKVVSLNSFPGLVREMDYWIVPKSHRGLYHQDESINWLIFLLNNWINGKVPPKRCEYTHLPGKIRCRNGVATDDVDFCEEHLCDGTILVDKLPQRCMDCCDPLVSRFCLEHKCVNCAEPRVSPQSTFCAMHCCAMCVFSGLDKVLPAGQCLLHQCQFGGCIKAKILHHDCCAEHLCAECAKRNVDKGHPIREGEEYCDMHTCQYPSCGAATYADVDFCTNHLCVACFYDHPSKYSVCDKNCDDHRCSTDGCRNLRQSPLLVCATHYPDEKKQCMGTKSNKTRCKAVTQIGGINDWYCQAHIHQAPPNLKLDIDFNFVDICYPIKSAQCNQKVGIEKCQEVGYISKESSRWKCFFHSLSPPSNEPVRPAIKKKFERKEEKNTAPEKVSSYATTLHDSGLSQDDLEDNLGISEEFDEAEVENDALGRLREIGDGVEDRDDYSEADIDDDRFQYLQSTDVDNVVVNAMQRELHDLAARFSWDLSVEERLSLSGKLLHLLCRLLNRLIMLSNEYISEGRREVSFAQSETLRLASIVGATVVGASTRLQAIRNARPSVVIVEEACEVLEPTLISVLAVDSIKKLQLIGDHFQLPASIQNDWFNISMDKNFRSLKKSLFERLIDSGMVPVTVLDIQRRMRWDISDTIRPFYRDLVEINDHQNTFSRSITMDNDIRNKLKGMGMTVPGIASTIFFWDLIDSQESPAEVGLSTINKGEAESVVGLTKWLLDCHVPASSITIITPYKGQSTDIYKRLRNLNLVGISQHGEHQGVNVSTVDRFQGDEADIVILSIVKSSKSAFVGLRNRFIVAASRARIGFFIIGCKNALTGADHWQRYLEILKFSTSNSPTGASRVARRLPLCCPYHDSVKATRYALSSRDFPIKERWGEFCKEPCQDILSWCSHACNLPCHVVPSAHNSNRREKVPSTCRDHPDAVVICQNVFEQTERVLKQSCLSLQEARNHYLCEEIVEDFLKSCQEHWIRSPKCHEYKSYIHTPPVCVEKVLFTRPTCGCVVKMTCVERAKEQLNPVRCEIRKTLKRPRCYHDMQLPCYCESELLRMWASNGCLSISGSTVKHGEKYGPSEIMVTTECRRKDTSNSKLVAAKTFIGNQVCVRTLRATDIGSVVNEDTEHYNIAFGQFVRLLGPNATTNTISSIDVIEYPPTNPVRVAFEKKRVEFSSERPAEELWVFHGTQSDSVTKIVQIGFKVGGQAGVPIVHGAALGSGVYTAKGPSTPLNYGGLKSVILARGLVGSRQRDSKFCNGDWVIFTSGSQLLPCYVVYFNEQQSTMSTPSPPIRGRTLRSGSPAGLVSSSAHHDQSIQSIVDCHDAISKILPCNSKVQYQRVCGHTVKGVACWAAFEYASGNLPYPDNCTVPIRRPCLFCRSSLDIPCWATNAYDQLQSLVPSDFCVNLSEHEFPDYQQQWSEVLTQHGELEILLHSLCAHGSLKFRRKCCGTSITRTCKEVFAFITAKSVLPKCTIMFSRSFPCGHEDRVPCWMFNSLAVCREWVQRKSPICGHQVNVRCNLSEKSWQPWGGGNMPIPTTQVGGDIHLYLEEHITKKRVQFNNGVRPGDWRCDKPCIIQRRCGHRKELLCCEALSDMPIPICTELSSIKCNKCTSLRHVPCNELDVEKLKPCKEEVTKKCTLCLVNDIRIPCDAMVAVCNKESSRMLPCKHSVTWLCGYYPVPSDRDCPTCLLQTWADANDREQRTQFDNPSIMRSFQAVVNDTMTVRWLDQVEVIADESIVGFRLDQHCIRRAQLMDASMKLVSNSQRLFSVDDSVLLFPLPPCPIDDDRVMMNYELVFIESKELARTKYVGNPFDVLRNTEFGRGITCTKLDMNSLSKCIPSDDNGDGSIEIIVRFAFRVRPFKGLRASLPKSMRQLRACYDCIELSDEPQRITYLHDCSIVPVKMIRLRVRLRCDYACLDFHDRKNCYFCPSCEPKHAICWECLIHYLES